jgi:IS605 OrfB family transposase
MKRVETVRLLPPDPAQLLAWLERFNAAANWLSGVAFRERLWHWLPLQRRAYREVRERFQLPAAATVVVIRKVAYAYRNKQRRQHRAAFRRRGGIPVCKHQFKRDGTVSVHGFRIPFIARPQAELSSRHQAVLCYRRGKFILHQVVEVDVPAPVLVQDYLGCDLGTTNLLTDSEAEAHSGQAVEEKRRIYTHRRRRLQRRGTRAARRKLRQISGRQGRYQRDVNHGIAKRVVAKAQRLCCGIALEDLRGIRDRIKARRRQRARLHNWGFGQLRQFIVYKAAQAGVPVVFVDPANTSRTCPVCGHVDKRNRRSQSEFQCRRCGHAGPADVIAARNIRAWARGDAPMVASARAATSPHPSRGDSRLLLLLHHVRNHVRTSLALRAPAGSHLTQRRVLGMAIRPRKETRRR